MAWLTQHDLTFRGDFPLNTAGGQLSFGQAGMAGRHAPRRRRRPPGDGPRRRGAGRATATSAFVTGNGGIMSEQVALILGGD